MTNDGFYVSRHVVFNESYFPFSFSSNSSVPFFEIVSESTMSIQSVLLYVSFVTHTPEMGTSLSQPTFFHAHVPISDALFSEHASTSENVSISDAISLEPTSPLPSYSHTSLPMSS